MGGNEQYDLLERIAAGGMGEVFLARRRGERGFQKQVAVKRILPSLAAIPSFVDRFVLEAKLAVSLSHANIVHVLDLGSAGEDLILVMEYVDGADVARVASTLQKRGEQIPLGIAVHVAVEALKGLAFAHDRVDSDGRSSTVIHCDISPSNLLLSYAGEVKIADFGVAQMMSQAGGGRVVGKLRYMSPEMLRGEKLDGRADLYALAVVVYELLTNQKVFDASEDEIPTRVLAGGLPDLATYRPDASRALCDLLARAMSVDPSRRPPSARQMLAEMTAIAHAITPAVTPPDAGAWLRSLVPSRAAPASTGFDAAMKNLLGAGPPVGTLSLSAPVPVGQLPENREQDAGGQTLTVSTFVTQRAPDGTFVLARPAPLKPAPARRRVAPFVLVGAVGMVGLGVGFGALRSTARPAPAASAAPSSSISVAEPSTSSSQSTPSTSSVSAPAPSPSPSPSQSAPKNGGSVVVTSPAIGAPGFVSVSAEPWADVTIDGKHIGSTPIVKHALPAGTHRVRLERKRAHPVERVIQIVPGRTQVVDADMIPIDRP